MLRSLSSACLILLAASSIRGAPIPANDLPTAATRIAEKLEKKHRQKVIVTDFMDSKNRVSALGKKLADDFSAALTNTSQSLQVLPRTGTIAATAGSLGSEMLEQQALWELYRIVGADAVIVGRLKLSGAMAEVQLTAWQVPSPEMPNMIGGAEKLDESAIKIPLEAGDEQLAAHLLQGNPAAQFELSAGLEEPKFPSPPRCNRCETLIPGKDPVELLLTIDKNGRVTKVDVTKAPNEKAGQQAAREAMKWSFRPALDANGKPIEAQLKYTVATARPSQ